MARPDPQDLWQYAFSQGAGALGELSGLQSKFAGLNTAGDVQSRFGLGKDTSAIYDPLRRNAASMNQQGLARASARSGGSATPGTSLFDPLEMAYGQQQNQLNSQQAGSDIQQQDFIASILQGAMGSQDQFGLQKSGMQGSMAQGLMGGVNQYMSGQYNQQDPGFSQYLMKLLGMGAQIGAALG